MKCYYGVNPFEKRKKLLESKAARRFIEEIIESADDAILQDSPAFKMSEYVMFYENGNRTVFERAYFDRRRKCNNIMHAYWLTEDEKYLMPLVDYITYICDEFTWCLPAHVELHSCLSKGTVEKIDLFQAETARFFAEIVMCVGDKLPEYTLDRMKYEVRRRILATLNLTEKNSKDIFGYYWEDSKMNWATVCGAGCVMAALYFGTDTEAENSINRFIGCLDSYLEGIDDDGCCKEGMAYWSYGFEHFVILAQAVKVYTEGRIDYFKNPKTHELALFPQRVRLSERKVASISDGGENFGFKIGLISLLKSIYDDVILPDLKYGSRRGNVDSVSELLWFDEEYKAEELTCDTHYLADSQWYICRKEKYSFVAKGGNNDEPHNHNDVGSFMITVGDEIFISDLGRGEYTRETFIPETRYSYIQNSSRGHSVPIINGEYQKEGLQYRAENATATDNTFEIDIQNAYPVGIVGKINRRFALSDNKVVLVDEFEYVDDNTTVTERFISKRKADISDGVIDFGVGKIKYDANKFTAEISTDSFVHPNGIDNVDVYIADIKAIAKESRFEIELVM